MYSLYTGEEYSATLGDYFMAPQTHIFKDSEGHPMFLAQALYTRRGNKRNIYPVYHGYKPK